MSSLLKKFLDECVIKIVQMPPGSEAELEIRSSVSDRTKFLHIIDSLSGFSVTPTFMQRRDILYRGPTGATNQCRTQFNGPKKLDTVFMIKTPIHQVREEEGIARNYVLANETLLRPETAIPPTRQGAFLKTRCLVQLDHWRIELVAMYVFSALNDAEILAKQNVYFGKPILSLSDFRSFIANPVYIFGINDRNAESRASGFSVEYELTTPLTAKNIPSIIDEFTQIDRVLFNQDKLAIKFRSVLHEVVRHYTSKRVESINTIKKATKQVVTLTSQLLHENFPFKHWFVTDKTDGTHAVFYRSGVEATPAYLLDSTLTELRALKSTTNLGVCIFDGELVGGGSDGTNGTLKEQHFLIFDVLMYDDIAVHTRPFSERQTYFEAASKIVREFMPCLSKTFTQLPDRNHDASAPATFNAALDNAATLAHAQPYRTDGLIFVSPESSYDSTTILKWKPSSHLTIDFLSKKVPADLLGTSIYSVKSGLTLYVLYCSIGAAERFRFDSAHITSRQFTQRDFGNSYPIPFQTSLGSHMYLYYDSDPNLDGQILELLPIWRGLRGEELSAPSDHGILSWKRIRIRDDKRIDMLEGDYFGNYWRHAEETLLTFLHPITLDNLKGNYEAYFTAARDDRYRSVTGFNNAIKRDLFTRYIRGTPYFLDLAAGRGSDIDNYILNAGKKIFVVERDIGAIQELISRKHSIYNNKAERYAGKSIPSILVLQQDLTASADLILKRLELLGAPPLPVATTRSNNSSFGTAPRLGFDAVSCFFAIHYLITNNGLLRNFISLVNRSLKPGGVFVFTTFDPDSVMSLLNKHNGLWTHVENGSRKYHIERLDNSDYQPRIRLQLPFTNGGLIEENLINKSELLDGFVAAGFTIVENYSFGSKFDSFDNNDFVKHFKDQSAADRIFVNLNMAVVVRKNA